MAPGDATNVVGYILGTWLKNHMTIRSEMNPRAVLFLAQLPQLYSKHVEHIMGKFYFMELKREPGVFWLERLEVQLVPPPDDGDNEHAYRPTVMTDIVVPFSSGFYRAIVESTENYETLIRLKVNRL